MLKWVWGNAVSRIYSLKGMGLLRTGTRGATTNYEPNFPAINAKGIKFGDNDVLFSFPFDL